MVISSMKSPPSSWVMARRFMQLSSAPAMKKKASAMNVNTPASQPMMARVMAESTNRAEPKYSTTPAAMAVSRYGRLVKMLKNLVMPAPRNRRTV